MNRRVRRIEKILPALTLLLGAGCDDAFGPTFWDATPDTITMYSASRAEYVGRASVLDITQQPVFAFPVEAPGATGTWDVALTDEAGGLALVPAASFDGVSESRARVAVLEGESFEDLESAPGDTTLYTAGPALLRPDAVYVLRSRRAACGLSSGSRYAKLEPIEIDAARGVFRFAIVRNPVCDDRSFVPPDPD